MRGRPVQPWCILFLAWSSVLLPAALAAGDNQYTIKEGETLFAVARRAQVPVDVLGAYNGISDAGKVRAGTVLRVPTAYVVKKGDTLFGIARTFGVPLAKILELNKLSADARLKVGARIFIPTDADRTVAAAAAVATAATTAQGTASGTTQSGAQSASGMEQSTAGIASRPGMVIVWPHPGRHEPDNGKIPGLVFFGAPGDVVRSATAGEVKWAATYWTRGKVVIIKSPDGTLFTYGGNAELLVNVGDRVSAGMDIAKLGESPQGGGARLYFSISDGTGKAVNPERFFSAKSDS